MAQGQGIHDLEINPTEVLLQTKLALLGECVPLKIFLQPEALRRDLSPFASEWRPYNPRKPGHSREGLSLTSLEGEFGGPDLDSLLEYNRENKTLLRESSFRTPTRALLESPSLAPAFEPFEVGRSHLIRFGKGGHFPPHRDSFTLSGECFRLICLLDNAHPNCLGFVLNGRQLEMPSFQLHLIDTTKVHSVFSFINGAQILVINALLTERNYASVLRHLAVI